MGVIVLHWLVGLGIVAVFCFASLIDRHLALAKVPCMRHEMFSQSNIWVWVTVVVGGLVHVL